MNRLTKQDRVAILKCLVEGMSIRATSRITGRSKNTVTNLLVSVGKVALDHQDATLQGLPCKRIQCDEIWSFVGAKQKNVEKGAAGAGDVWTWTAICADTKIVPTWRIGTRDGDTAKDFIVDLAGRLSERVQLTTDGHKPYIDAVDAAFGCNIDYAMLIKDYKGGGSDKSPSTRYSPGKCCGTEKRPLQGTPDPAHISTSYVERCNLTMRMSMRRFTRLTNAFSKKVENHAHAVALHFWHYNFARIHKTLKVTPAMAAGVTEHLLDLGDLVNLLEKREAEEDEANPVRPGRKAKNQAKESK